MADIKVFRIEGADSDGYCVAQWWAGKTADDVQEAFCSHHDVLSGSVTQDEIPHGLLSERLVQDEDTGKVFTFKEFLLHLIAQGVQFPAFFAEDEC